MRSPASQNLWGVPSRHGTPPLARRSCACPAAAVHCRLSSRLSHANGCYRVGASRAAPAAPRGCSLWPLPADGAGRALTRPCCKRAGELARALLYARPPDWADREAGADADRPDAQRLAALVALLAAAPAPAGAALAGHVFSPHLDLFQRVLVLEALAGGAAALARSAANPTDTLDAPPLPPAAAARRAGGGAEAPGRSRRWGARSLARLAAPAPRASRNRFPEVAADWAGALLAGCGAPVHGVDLFGRDALLLGRLLATLGAFAECAAPAPAAAGVAAAVLELLAAPGVHAHPQPFVRRSALVAASQARPAGHGRPGRACQRLPAGALPKRLACEPAPTEACGENLKNKRHQLENLKPNSAAAGGGRAAAGAAGGRAGGGGGRARGARPGPARAPGLAARLGRARGAGRRGRALPHARRRLPVHAGAAPRRPIWDPGSCLSSGRVSTTAVWPGHLRGRAAGACRSAVAVLRLAEQDWLQPTCSVRFHGARVRLAEDVACVPHACLRRASATWLLNQRLRHAVLASSTLSKEIKLACMLQQSCLPGPAEAQPDAAVPPIALRWREPARRAGQAGGRGARGDRRRRRPCAAHAAGGAANCHAARPARRVRSSQPGLLIPWCVCLLMLLCKVPFACFAKCLLQCAASAYSSYSILVRSAECAAHHTLSCMVSHPVSHGTGPPHSACPINTQATAPNHRCIPRLSCGPRREPIAAPPPPATPRLTPSRALT